MLKVFGDNTMGFNWSGLRKQISRANQNRLFGYNTMGLNWSELRKRYEDTRIYSPDELAELNRVIAATGNYAALSDNAKAQLENTYTPEQKALRAWSNAKQAADRESNLGSFNWGNLGSALGSLFTGGISDMVRGEAPGTAINSLHPAMSIINPVTLFTSSASSLISDMIAGAKKASDTEGSFFDKIAAAIDRSLDINGAVDTATRYTGEGLKIAAPAITPYLQTAGTAIGTLIGMFTPITPFGGALVGNALGGKLQQGTSNKDYLKSWQDAGVVAGTYGLGKVVAPYLSSLVGGGTLGKVAGSLGKSVIGKALKAAMGLAKDSSGSTLASSGSRADLLKSLLTSANGSTESTGINKAISTLIGGGGSALLTGKSLAGGLDSTSITSPTAKYAKDALASLVSNPSELSDAMSNMALRNTGMIAQPEWLVNTADMDKEEKKDYTLAIKELMSS
jgi:hypothetical protein